MSIRYRYGTEITNEEAARLIEAEGRLIVGELASPEGRCVLGVLGDYTGSGWSTISRKPLLGYDCWDMVDVNNAFEGTPEERAIYMAAWLRTQGDK